MKWFHMYYFISVKSPTRHNYSHFTDEKLKYRLKEGGISDDSTSRKPGSNAGIDIWDLGREGTGPLCSNKL